MRHWLYLLPALALMALFVPTGGSQADPYKWCAQYGSAGDGARNCGFVTYEQCLATISGMNGACEPNPFYTGPERSQRPARRHYRYDRSYGRY